MSWRERNNFEFDTVQNIENEFVISGITSAPKDMHWFRKKDELPLLPHNAGTPHPTNPCMMTSYGAHILTSGSIEIILVMDRRQYISPEHARNFAHYLDSQFPEAENTVEMSIGANGYIKQFCQSKWFCN